MDSQSEATPPDSSFRALREVLGHIRQQNSGMQLLLTEYALLNRRLAQTHTVLLFVAVFIAALVALMISQTVMQIEASSTLTSSRALLEEYKQDGDNREEQLEALNVRVVAVMTSLAETKRNLEQVQAAAQEKLHAADRAALPRR